MPTPTIARSAATESAAPSSATPSIRSSPTSDFTGVPLTRHALRLQFVRDARRRPPPRREQVAGALEEVHVEPATGQGLGHLDADVAATDDRRRLGSRHRGVAVDALAVDCAHVGVGAGGVVGVRFGDVRVDRGRGVHVVKGEGAVQPAHVEGAGLGAAARGDQQVVVALFDRLALGGLDGDGLRIRVDGDDLVIASEIDPALLDLTRRQRESRFDMRSTRPSMKYGIPQ